MKTVIIEAFGADLNFAGVTEYIPVNRVFSALHRSIENLSFFILLDLTCQR